MLSVDEKHEDLVFVPSRGFRSAHVIETPANVVVERDGRTLTAALVSDRDTTTLHFTVIGFDPPDGWDATPNGFLVKESARVTDDRGREVAPHPRWTTAGRVGRRGDGTMHLDWQLKLVPLREGTRRVTLEFGGPAGDWRVDIPVTTTTPQGIAAIPVSTSDTHHDISLEVTALARDAELTAIELKSIVAPHPDDLPSRPKRYVQGIGGHGFGSRVSSEVFVLRDDRGAEYREVSVPPGGAPIPGREVIRFGPVVDQARFAVLEVPFVTVQERTDESLSLAVPSDGTVEFLGCRTRFTVSRETDREGRWVRIEIRPEVSAPRQIAEFRQATVAGGTAIGMRVVHCAGQPTVIQAPDPAGSAPTVTLKGPVLTLAGPWKITLPLRGSMPPGKES